MKASLIRPEDELMLGSVEEGGYWERTWGRSTSWTSQSHAKTTTVTVVWGCLDRKRDWRTRPTTSTLISTIGRWTAC